jgi:1-acyl-sn-glycerol-3-phosphate acyltransferase
MTAPRSRDAVPEAVARYSPRHMAFFDFMFTRFFGRHMRAARMPHWGLPPAGLTAPDAGMPLIILANHPSWWDGVAFMLLSRRLFPGRRMFIPMEAAALERYPFMKRLGVFGVEMGSTRGAVAFIRTAQAVLADPNHMIWMNVPGRFADARERPLPVVPGVARLPELAPGAMILPLALEYPLWTERAAEMLAAFGPPVAAADLLALDRDARSARIGAMIEASMDRLAEDAIARDPARCAVIVQGQEGMGGIWQTWRHLRATLRGERFDPRHIPSQPREASGR